MLKFVVTKYSKKENSSAFLGTFNMLMEIPIHKDKNIIMYFNDCRLFHKNGARWVSFASREYEKNGMKQYFSLCGFNSREDSDELQKLILKAIEDYCAANQPHALPATQKPNQEPVKPEKAQCRELPPEPADDFIPF